MSYLLYRGGKCGISRNQIPRYQFFKKEALEGKNRISTVQFPKFTM